MKCARMRLAFVAMLVALAPACRTRVDSGNPRDWYVDGSFSALPAVGVALGGGKFIHQAERFDLAAELEGTYQFLDDTDFADDGKGEAGDFVQARLGLKHSYSPGHRRHFTLRYGLVWFRATGSPLILEEPGDYFGGYVGAGFETDLSPRWTMGPELRLLAAGGEGSSGFELVPQFAWHLIFNF